MRVGLFDTGFSHLNWCCGYSAPLNMTWDRNTPFDNKVVLFDDGWFEKVNECPSDRIKIAWLLEPHVIHPDMYPYIEQNFYKFNYVVTSHKYLKDKIPNYVWHPSAGSWLYREEWGITPKNKNVSIIASHKNYAPGHQFRHVVISALRNKFDFICGKGYMEVPNKKVAFVDYRFSVVIANCQEEGYFTDTLIDPLLLGTIPIYYGWPKIVEPFNPRGFIFFNSVEKLSGILDRVRRNGEQIYNEMLPYIIENFETAKSFGIMEDFLYDNLLNKLEDK